MTAYTHYPHGRLPCLCTNAQYKYWCLSTEEKCKFHMQVDVCVCDCILWRRRRSLRWPKQTHSLNISSFDEEYDYKPNDKYEIIIITVSSVGERHHRGKHFNFISNVTAGRTISFEVALLIQRWIAINTMNRFIIASDMLEWTASLCVYRASDGDNELDERNVMSLMCACIDFASIYFRSCVPLATEVQQTHTLRVTERGRER